MSTMINIQTKKEKFTKPLYLESGRILEEFEIIYETYGKLNEDKSNIIIICHALAGSHHAAGRYSDETKAGWWDKFIGDGKAIDTNKYFVICSNNIGSSYGSTNPLSINPSTKEEYRLKFPVLAISDIVNAQMRLYERLGIKNAYAVIGGSMGGMQTLCYSIEHPNFAKHYIALATTAYTRPWAIAINKIAIETIRQDIDFKNGFYDKDDIKAKGLAGLAIGRMAGLIAYLSPELFSKKFRRDYVDTDGLYELFGRFQVERYLEYNSYNFPKHFDPLSYLYICKTMNIFDAGRNKDKLEDSFSKIQGQLHLISFSDDMLFFPQEMEEIRDIMIKIGKEKQVSYKMIQSNSGHDSFLVEVEKFEEYIKEILKDKNE